MFELELCKEVKFKIPNNGTDNIYRLCLTNDVNDNPIPIVYWTEYDGFKNAGASAGYKMIEIKRYFETKSWVVVE